MVVLALQDVRLGFGGPPLLDGVSFTIDAGERVCLLGRNGAGKSTLMKVIDGTVEPDAGTLTTAPGLRIARLVQEVPSALRGCNFWNVAGGLGEAGEALGEAHDLALRPEADPARVAALEERITREGWWPLRADVERALARLDLPPDEDTATQSAGLKRRVLFARAIVADPDLLLLDEPTNHLDLAAIERLEELLLSSGKTLLFTTHDRAFLRRVASRIFELDRGRLTAWGCGYDEMLERRDAALEVEARAAAAFDKKLAEEEAWIRKGVKERRTRNEGRVRELQKLREQRAARRERVGDVKMKVQEAERSGRLVIEAKKIGFAWDPDRPIVEGFSTTIMRGDRVGVIGPNGSGKTTLLRILLGGQEPDTGTVRHGTNLEVAYFDQQREQLDESKTVAENVAAGDRVTVDGVSRHVLGYLQDFLFSPEQARRPIGELSGGERNRLLLARLFTQPANVLVLDEPTNDLDLETLELLEHALRGYSGTVLLVSHDRAFLDAVVTSTIAFEPDGGVRESVGGYEDWVRQRAAAAPPPARTAKKPPPVPKSRPKRLTFAQKNELAELPARIEALEAEQAALYERMADPALARDGAAMVEAKGALERVGAELAVAYARWEELEAIDAG